MPAIRERSPTRRVGHWKWRINNLDLKNKRVHSALLSILHLFQPKYHSLTVTVSFRIQTYKTVWKCHWFSFPSLEFHVFSRLRSRNFNVLFIEGFQYMTFHKVIYDVVNWWVSYRVPVIWKKHSFVFTLLRGCTFVFAAKGIGNLLNIVKFKDVPLFYNQI